MNKFVLLRDEAVDGTGGGGGTSAPAAPTPTPVAPGGSGQEQVKDIWGGRSAPDWAKQAGLGRVHDESNLGGAIDKGNEAPAGSSPTGARPAVVGTPAAPVIPQAPAAPALPPVTPAAPVTPITPTLDVNAIADAVTRAQAIAAQRTGQPAAVPTEAEVRAQLGVYEATDEDYEAIMGVKPDDPKRVAALNGLLQKIAKQAVTISQVVGQRALAQQQREVAPYIESVRAQEAVRQREMFSSENPDLKGYEALAQKEYTALVASGAQFPNVAAARKAVADATRATLKSINIVPVSTAPSSVPGAPAPLAPVQSRRMTTTSVGGRGGGSGGPSATPTSVESVWGKK